MYGNNIPAAAAAGQKEPATTAASPLSARSTPSSPRPGEEPNPTTTSSIQPAGEHEQPAPEELDPGCQATGTPSVSSPQPHISASAALPPRATPSTSAIVKPAATLRLSQPDPAANTAVVEVTGRGSTPRTSARNSNSGGGGGGGGNVSNNLSGGREEGDRSGSGGPSTAAGGESGGMGGETIVDHGGDPDRHGGDASVFPRMLARNAPDFSFARSRFDADPSELSPSCTKICCGFFAGSRLLLAVLVVLCSFR